MPPIRNKFAKQLPTESEQRRRLYLLDTDPLHSLQVFNMPQYLPKEIHCYKSFSPQDLLAHHERVIGHIAQGNLTFGYDEDGVEKSLAFIFGVPISKMKKRDPAAKQVKCLLIYYEVPELGCTLDPTSGTASVQSEDEDRPTRGNTPQRGVHSEQSPAKSKCKDTEQDP